jgi:Sec1 family
VPVRGAATGAPLWPRGHSCTGFLAAVVYCVTSSRGWQARHSTAQHSTRARRELGQLVQDRLSRWALADGGLFTAPPCDLLILDRGHDPVAPAVHPFTYAAMTHDLVPLGEGGVFTYTWQDARGQVRALRVQRMLW